jgi:hypothetical protein
MIRHQDEAPATVAVDQEERLEQGSPCHVSMLSIAEPPRLSTKPAAWQCRGFANLAQDMRWRQFLA